MRVLWVKAGGVVPADSGGRIRSLHILKELARALVEKQFTWKTAGAQFEAILQNAVCGVPNSVTARKTA